MLKIFNCEQKSEEWFKLREQYPLTASKAQAIGNQGKGLETLIWEKLSEKYSSANEQKYTNKDLERGIELEPLARSIYELETGLKVKEVGFIIDDKISKFGGVSPDGMIIGAKGLVEIKCFDDKKHFQYSIEGLEPESQYLWQMQMQMLFTGTEWCDFVSYNPSFRSNLLKVRIYANIEMQNKIKEGLKTGEQLILKIENKIKKQ